MNIVINTERLKEVSNDDKTPRDKTPRDKQEDEKIVLTKTKLKTQYTKKMTSFKTCKIKDLNDVKNNVQEEVINKIIECIETVYNSPDFYFCGCEGHYQQGMAIELAERNITIQNETVVPCYYTSSGGNKIQLTNGVYGREDITLPKNKIILELKTIKAIGMKEINQLCRYMLHRRKYDDWGEETQGFVVNFNTQICEIVWCYFKENTLFIVPYKTIDNKNKKSDYETIECLKLIKQTN